MARDMHNIRPRFVYRNGERLEVFQVRVRLRDRQGILHTATETFEDHKAAVEWRDYERSKAQQGELGIKLDTTRVASRTTFADLLNRYTNNWQFLSKVSNKNEKIAIKAFREHPIGKNLINKTVLEIMRDGPRFFIAYRDSRQARGVSPATINRDLSPIRHMFNIARSEWGFDGLNPFAGWKTLHEGKGRARVLSFEQERKLIDGIQEQCRETIKFYRWCVLVWMALNTALRRGVLLNILWEDVDLERETITIKPTYWNGRKKAPPEVPIPFKLMGHLRTYRMLLKADQKTAKSRLFPFEKSKSGYDSDWQRIVAKAGLDNLNFHDLRHTAVTRFAKRPKGQEHLELSTRENAYLLGHSYGTTSRYEHLELVEGIRAKLNEVQKLAFYEAFKDCLDEERTTKEDFRKMLWPEPENTGRPHPLV